MISDAALVLRARGGDELAFQRLAQRFDDTIGALSAPYFLPGGQRDDLRQEALFGLHKAVRDYRSDRGSSFRHFANLVIERQIITAVKTATREKHRSLNECVSMSNPLPGFSEDDGVTLADSSVFADETADPAVRRESVEELRIVASTVHYSLTPLERKAVLGIANGITYEEIAADHDVSAKTIDNAAQRAKRKLAQALEAA